MLRILVAVMLMLALVPSMNAGLLPTTEYCLRQGYQIYSTDEPRRGWCVFDDGTRCNIFDFYNGTCGQEHVGKHQCKKEGERLDLSRQYVGCCKGLEEIKIGISVFECQPIPNIFQRFWTWIISIFY